MTITKYGHCCLLIEFAGKRVLTDPGAFSKGFENLTELDVILITHEHGDHLHTESLKTLVEKNPEATVVTNASVGKILTELGVEHTIFRHEQSDIVAEVALKAYEGKHVEIVGEFGLVQNTGFLVDGKFFYPGDAYTVPAEAVQILALPVAGPWCKVSEAIEYALAINPKRAVPVHDAVLSEVGKTGTYSHFKRELEAKNISFSPLIDSEPNKFDG